MTTPAPVYDPKIPPGPSTSIGDGQTDFLENFMALYNAFMVNHVPLDASESSGDHTIIQLLDQTGQFQTNAGEISVYAKQILDSDDIPTQSDQIFMRYQGNAQEFAFTNYQLYNVVTPNPLDRYYFTSLPGGLIVYFGLVNVKLANQGFGESFPFKLLPAICKNIMSVNFCTVGTVSNLVPIIVLEEPNTNGIYTTIGLIDIIGSVGGRIPPTQLYFIVVGNT